MKMITDAFDNSEVLFGTKDFYGEQKHLCDQCMVVFSEQIFEYMLDTYDHQECYKEVGSQAISYTTGVPAMIGAALVVDKVWDKDGVFNIEEFDPDPFMDMLNQYGLPWVVDENPQTVA